MLRRRTALLAVLLLIASAACGQKSGVHVASGRGGDLAGFSAGEGDAGTGVEGESGTAGDAALAGEAGGGGVGGTGAAGGTSGGAAGGAAGGKAGAKGGTAGATGGNVAKGPVWGDKIVIGIHAPITGAAPLPSSFAAAAKVWPDYINSKGGINGRKVEAVVVDDKYTPSTAVQVCTELVQQKNAFLVIGGGGTDQIQACARRSAELSVPYLSAGVTEVGLRSLKNYFAVSMSYPQQGPYLANFIKKQFPDKANAVGMVYSDTPNFADAVKSFADAMPGVKLYKLSRNPSQTELNGAARTMCTDQRKVVYPLMAPTNWLFLAGQAKNLCSIQWSGVGLTMGLNTVARTGCEANNSVDGATFFSPFPGVDKAPGLDPEFVEAVKGKPDWDDIYVSLWSVTKAVGKIIEASGKDLTRAGFVAAAEKTANLSTGMAPVLSYTPGDHFGARQVHVLKANCSKRAYDTLATFASY